MQKLSVEATFVIHSSPCDAAPIVSSSAFVVIDQAQSLLCTIAMYFRNVYSDNKRLVVQPSIAGLVAPSPCHWVKAEGSAVVAIIPEQQT